MASCSSLLTEEHLLCAICLDVFTQPVSTPCGHNFCMSCISSYWGSHVVCNCPVCKEGFDRRPDLKVNTFISELTSQFMSLKVTGTHSQRPVQESASCGHVVLCDVCTDTQQTAVKSCLECLTSYCDVHLEPHHRAAGLKRHTLLEPMSSLEDRICKEHAQLLTRFCRDDNVLLCDVCCSLKHLNHNVISGQQAYKEAKATLQGWEADVQQMKKERLEKVKEMTELVEKSKTETKNVIAGSVRELTQLVSQIQQSQADLVQVIEEKQKETQEQADAFFDSMGQTMKELQSTEMKIRELKQTEDSLHLLINMPKIAPRAHEMDSLSFNGLVEIYRIRKCLSKTVPQMRKLLKEMNEEIKELSSSADKPSPIYLKYMRQYVVDISLDPTTAHPLLTISDDRKQVKFDTGSVSYRHESPNMFREDFAVLGDTALSTYKFYFEVFVGRKSEWCLGMATKSIQRKSTIPRRPGCGLWAIWFKEDRFETFCCPNLIVHHGKVEQVGVFVRYETSSIHFYDVQTLTEIYRFTKCSFTEKLYPCFNPCDDEYDSNLDPMIILPVKRTERM